MFPYKLAGGLVGGLVLAGSLYYQSLQIHHYHNLYDTSLVTIALKDQQIKDMTSAQKDQNNKTEDLINKVLGSKPSEIINQIKATPGKGCSLPKYPKEVNDAY